MDYGHSRSCSNHPRLLTRDPRETRIDEPYSEEVQPRTAANLQDFPEMGLVLV